MHPQDAQVIAALRTESIRRDICEERHGRSRDNSRLRRAVGRRLVEIGRRMEAASR